MKLKKILSTVALLGAFTTAGYAADIHTSDVQAIQSRLAEEPGVAMEIGAPNTKHWHGAAPHHTFQHIAIMKPADNMSTTWLEPVNDEEYNKLANK